MIPGTRSLTTTWLRLGVLLLMVAGATGCSGISWVSSKFLMMSPSQEIRFGSKVAEEVEKREQLVSDPQVVDYVREVGQRVLRNSPPSEIPIHFYVVKDDTINAFAIPGGNIYVNTGLLKAVDDEAELASVMAHEAGHAARRHSARQISNNVPVEMINNIILPENSPQLIKVIDNLFAKGVMFNFSRTDEFEADAIAVHTLYQAGYDPQAMDHLFNKLVQTYGDKGPTLSILEKFSNYASTHPSTRERMARVESVSRRFPAREYPSLTTELRRVQGRLKQLNLIN